MGFMDTVLSDTVGVAWRAASGTVDPWSKNELVDQATQAYTQAGMNPDQAAAQAQADVTMTLLSVPPTPGVDATGADPSQFSDGLKRSVQTGSNDLYILALGVGVVIFFYFYLESRKFRAA